MVFPLIVGSMILGDVAWWTWADRRLRRGTRLPALWRVLLALFSGSMLGYLAWFVAFPDAGRHAHRWMPGSILAAIYLWHFLVLPATLVAIVAGEVPRWILTARRRLHRPRLAVSPPAAAD